MSRLTNSELIRRNEMFVQGMLWCAGHKQFEPVRGFRKYNPKTRSHHTNYGYRFYCTRYATEVQNPNRADRQSKFSKERNVELKKYWVELAGGKCQRCGFDEFVSALEFHHVYPALKKGNPSTLIFNNNKEKVWRELDKCCLLCSICHRAHKAREWQAEFIKREGLGWTIGAELPLDDKRYETDKPPAYNQAPLPLFTYEPENGHQLKLFEPPVLYEM